MTNVRPPHHERLKVLLAETSEPWGTHLPRLLEPQGVRAIRVASGEQAVEVIDSESIHVAVVDMGLPLKDREKGRGESQPGPEGLKLLEVMRRLERCPPALIVVRGRAFDPRLDHRLLREAMRLNVFSVLDQPVELEQMLKVLWRAMERFYGGFWPADH